MKVVIVGLGVQGRKRRAVAGRDVVATVDPAVSEATYSTIEQVPLKAFDAALVCTPDQTKLEFLRYLVSHGKHVLVEKPLVAHDDSEIEHLMTMAREAGVACYTAYNHRFEPHLAGLKALVERGTIGTVYLARGLYGNGTARNVRKSPWRDEGLGVLSDLGSHLLDIARFLFGAPAGTWELWSSHAFENRAFDHALFGTRGMPSMIFEASLVSWRNTFRFEVVGERGSAHVEGLCKWGPSTLTICRRVLPSGRPQEEVQRIEGPDRSWALEYEYFTQLCRTGGTNLETDLWINRTLRELAPEIGEVVSSS